MEGLAGARLAVFAPTPVLTVTIESGDEQGPEMHFHPGGQGVWVSRMAAALGAKVVLCAAVAGEAGDILSALLESEGVELRSIRAHGRSGSYIHDRRSGERVPVAETRGPRLWRHEMDDLYGVILAAGLDADLTLLTGPQPPDAVSADIYERLAGDLQGNGGRVIADLTGSALQGALAGGIELLKINGEELVEEGLAQGRDPAQLLAGARRLREAGADVVVVSRAGQASLAILDDTPYRLTGPHFAAHDPIGAGDSMFAAIGVALAAGREPLEAMRMGVAAGALNVTRGGLGTGRPADVARLMSGVHVSPLEEPGSLGAGRSVRAGDDVDE